MNESKRISRLEYLEAQRRFYANITEDPDLKTIILYDLDKEIEEEKRKLKANE